MKELPDFLKPLERLTRPFPEAAVRAAIARREEALPHFLASLEWVVTHAGGAEDEEYFLHLYALYILAEFRETRAYQPAIALGRHPQAEELLGDTITEGFSEILGSLSGGDPGPVLSLIEDREANEWARAAGVRALGAMHLAGMMSRERFSSIVGGLFQGGLEREPGNPWDLLAGMAADFGLEEHHLAIASAYQDGLLDPLFDSLEGLEGRLFDNGEMSETELDRYSMIDSAIDAMSWWYCFESDADREAVEQMMAEEKEGHRAYLSATAAPYRREGPKVGRNDPCPCGSGRKYKKCCGQ